MGFQSHVVLDQWYVILLGPNLCSEHVMYVFNGMAIVLRSTYLRPGKVNISLLPNVCSACP